MRGGHLGMNEEKIHGGPEEPGCDLKPKAESSHLPVSICAGQTRSSRARPFQMIDTECSPPHTGP